MKTSVERVDDTTVRLHVTVEQERVDAAFAEAAQHLAADVKVPGFRPGRVPKKVLERRVGTAAVAQHALRDALPTFYTEAVTAEELDVVGPPEFDVERFEEGAEGAFVAEVAVRPEVQIPDYEGRRIAHPEWEVTDEEVREQLDELRSRFAELVTVDRPAQVGDHVRITVIGSKDGQRDEDASAEDLLYEIGDPAQSNVELDRQLLGSKAGDVMSFRDTLGPDFAERAGDELDFRVILKEVKTRQLPDLDDDFALTASEFDTIEELTEAVRTGLARSKRAYARQALRSAVVEEIAADVDVPLPEVLVDEAMRGRLSQIAAEADRHEVDFATYVQATGMQPEELESTLRAQAEQTVRAQLIIDAVGRAAGISISNDDLGAEVARQAVRMGRPVEEVAEMLGTGDNLQMLATDAFRRRTIDHLIEAVQITDPPPDDDTDLDQPAPDLDQPAPDLQQPPDLQEPEVPEAGADEGADEV